MTISARILTIALTGLALLLVSCRDGEDFAQDQELRIDPRSAFPEFAVATKAGTTAASFDLWAADPCSGGNPSDDRLALGLHFSTIMPLEGSWDRAETVQGALLVGWEEGALRPTSFVYAEKTDGKTPGSDLRTFRTRLDTRLRKAAGSTSLDLAAPAAGGEEVTPPDAVDSEIPAQNATAQEPIAQEAKAEETTLAAEPPSARPEGSAPLGFASEEGSFSGWRWVGKCSSPPADNVSPHPDALQDNPSQPASRTGLPLLRISTIRGTWQPRQVDEPSPARMVLAIADVPDHSNFGLQLAIVCVESPTCQQGPQLAQLLGSIRFRPASNSFTLDPSSQRFENLAKEIGLEDIFESPSGS